MLTFLVGCGGQNVKITTKTKKVYVDVLYCPAPPVVTRPELPIHNMTAEQMQQDGEVAKHYKATVNSLLGYSKELEKIVNNQKEINRAYVDKKKELESAPK